MYRPVLRPQLGFDARSLLALATVGLLSCTADSPKVVPDPAPAPVAETEPSRESPATTTDAGIDDTTDSGAERATGESEPSESEPELADTVEPAAGARLCARPYRVSDTPGKGAIRPGQDDAGDYERAAKQLARGRTVAVDERPEQPWTPKLGVEFDGLDPTSAHTITVRDADGRKVRTLKLDFRRRGSDDLCLGFDSFYATHQLRALRTGARCGPCVTR